MSLAQPSRFELAQTIYAPRIARFANKRYHYLPGVDACEIEQELLEVLWLCCTTYDPDQGAKFNTYFWTAAKRRFIDLHRAASRKMRVGDYSRVWLDQQSVYEYVHQYLTDASAEDEALAEMHVIEIYRSKKR